MSTFEKRFSGGVLLLSLCFYLYTLAPVVTFVDSGELAAVIGTRGVPHPPGFPLYVLLASFFATLPIGSFIWRLNTFSALCAALSVAITFLVFSVISKSQPVAQPKQPKQPKPVKKKKKGKAKEEKVSVVKSVPIVEQSWIGAAAASLALMTNHALWSTATVTEVYALHALLIALFCLFFFLYTENRTSDPRSIRYLALASVITGLGLSNYPPFGILAPAVIFYLYRLEKSNLIKDWRRNLRMLGLIAAGLLPYAILWIRARSGPLLNWGNPSNWNLFWKHISGQQYSVFLGSPKLSALPKALSLWWDQWPVVIWLLILPGMLWMWRLRSGAFYFTVILGVSNVLYVLSYDITDIASAPSDFYAYLLPLCWVSSLWIGFGAHAIFIAAKWLFRKESASYAAAALLIVAIPVVSAAAFWRTNNRHHYIYADDFARNILRSVAPNALILAPDWTFVSPAFYLQHVERVRNDVTVLDTDLLRRSWYFGYVRRRAPWLADTEKNAITEFLRELAKFEDNRPFNPEFTTAKYVAMINGFISAGSRLGHPAYILLNLEAKEEHPREYREWELRLGRPPVITLGVPPAAIGNRYVWVPETPAFRLYSESKFHSLPPVSTPDWIFNHSKEYDPITQGVIARYAEFFRWRGDYLRLHQDCAQARAAYEKALQIQPDLIEALDGLAVCSK
jgi:hypothetical protein